MGLFSLFSKPKKHGFKSGKRSDLGDIHFRSGWEANYARYLNFLMKQNVIWNWEYECETFWFNEIKRGVRSYLPDFKVWQTPTKFYFVEVKGYMDSKSKTKIKRMAKYYPKVKLEVVGRKQYFEIKVKLSKLIPNWE